MVLIAPPKRTYSSPEVESLTLSTQGLFCQSNITDYYDNPIYEEIDA